ncbi:DNA excision repair protein ERCC-1 isoform X2 [Folsomia candida]|uniref:DNA excision repair protein ERCC-1 isoform X2 n=1 Tax=Folsomia candida TaxID=158441 RepID=UPI0016055CE9|nr:DNA excision repair protein ERCC-1 isoform X2 [Folsomia candida]
MENRQDVEMLEATTSANASISVRKTNTASASSSSSLPVPSAAGGGPLSKGSILRGNPVLKHIRSVPWEYDPNIQPDYVVGATACVLFLSIRYHNLHPDYIHDRLKELRGAYDLRVLLVQVDVADPYPILKTLSHIAMLADLTILMAHGAEEAAKILENYKVYENKPPELIQEKQDPSIMQQVIDSLTSIRSVNKTDAMTLLRVFGSLDSLIEASPDKIALCPGIGPQKAQRIFSALHEKFKLT